MPDRRKVSDLRLHEARAECPDGDGILVPTGDMYSTDPGIPPSGWFIAFRCPSHPEEVIPIWRPAFQPLIEEVLEDVDIASLPVIGPTEV